VPQLRQERRVRALPALAEAAVDPAGLDTLGQRRREREGVEPQASFLWEVAGPDKRCGQSVTKFCFRVKAIVVRRADQTLASDEPQSS
jgi:hypothetical protein